MTRVLNINKVFLIPFVLFTASFAQAQELPAKEFRVSLSADHLEIAKGESKKIEMKLVCSKEYSKSDVALGLSSPLPKGIVVRYQPEKGIFSTSEVTIEVGSTVESGEYSLILNANLRNKTKGSILKVIVQ